MKPRSPGAGSASPHDVLPPRPPTSMSTPGPPALCSQQKGIFQSCARPAPSLMLCIPSFLISPGMCQSCLFKNQSLTLDCLTERSPNLLGQHTSLSKFGLTCFSSSITASPLGFDQSLSSPRGHQVALDQQALACPFT